MTRILGTNYRNQIEARANTELTLMFATVTHPDLGVPIRVVSEDIAGISYANRKIINYNWQGFLYLGCPFTATLLTDDDQPPRAQLSVPNIDRKIGIAVRQCHGSPRFDLALLKLSDFNVGVYDSNNAVTPIGTPEVNYRAKYLFLRNTKCPDDTLTADISTFDIANEPCPPLRTTQDNCPAVYR